MGTASNMSGMVWRTPAITVERVEIPTGVSLHGHGHDVPHLCFLEEGSFEERHAGRQRGVAPGTLRTSPAGDEHDLVFQAPSRCLLMLIHGDPAAVAPRLPDERRFIEAPRIRSLAVQASRSLSSPFATSPLHMEALVLELIAATILTRRPRRGATPPPWLARIREWLRSEPATPPSTVELASDVAYHPVYVARAFREYYGVGLGEYARLVRAEYAHELLATTEEPLAQVALRAGYADQSHLTRAVRRLLGTTPVQVRRKRGRIVQVASIQDLGSDAS